MCLMTLLITPKFRSVRLISLKYYDDLIFYTQLWQTHGEGDVSIDGETYTVSVRELKKKLFLCMNSVNALKQFVFTSALPARLRLLSAN